MHKWPEKLKGRQKQDKNMPPPKISEGLTPINYTFLERVLNLQASGDEISIPLIVYIDCVDFEKNAL